MNVHEAAERLLKYHLPLSGGGHSMICQVCIALQDALWFVPKPEDMSGYGDPDAPDEVKDAIRRAARVHGIPLEQQAEKP